MRPGLAAESSEDEAAEDTGAASGLADAPAGAGALRGSEESATAGESDPEPMQDRVPTGAGSAGVSAADAETAPRGPTLLMNSSSSPKMLN